jgi:hypothetical protein
MPKVGYFELRDEIQINMPPVTKIDCETKNREISHLQLLPETTYKPFTIISNSDYL